MSLACVILAGGRSLRMGKDKALIQFNGKALIDHVIARMRPQCSEILINANGNISRFSYIGLPVLQDCFDNDIGPLAGILRGMQWAAARGDSHVLTVAVDLPFLPSDLAQRLKQARGAAIAASDFKNHEMRAHPTCGLWPVSYEKVLKKRIDNGDRRLMSFAQDIGASLVSWSSVPDPFFNVNTPEDIAKAIRLWDKSHLSNDS